RLETRKALLFLRRQEPNHTFYEYLIDVKYSHKADILLVVDFLDEGTPPSLIEPITVWVQPKQLEELIDTPSDKVVPWLGRLVASQLRKRNFDQLIPYRTAGGT